MATYEEIHGKRVKELSSDPTLNSTYEGQVWYNESSGTLKSVVNFTAWASTTALPAGKYYGSGAGEKDSTLVFAGLSDSTTLSPSSFEYNGSGWITEGNLNTGRRSTGGTGTATAALCVGGYPDPTGNKTEEYNGSSWTETGNVPRQGHGMGVFGTEPAAFACGGGTGPATTTVDVYNGSTWTSGTSLSTARFASQGAGTTTAGLIFGGEPGFGAGSTATESWDGSSWTTLANLNTGRTDFAGGGTQTAALGWAGRSSGPTDSVKTEQWNGTSWTEVSNYPTGTNAPQGSSGPATSTAATAAGGAAPGPVATANEFNQSINTITAAAWASGGATNTALGSTAGCGSQTAGLVFSGADNLNNTELYNGSSWTAGPTLGTGRYGAGEATNAPQTAALCFGGYSNPPGTNRAQTEEFDGSSWSEQTDLPTGIRQLSGFGIQTAAVSVSGWDTNYVAESYEYNGSSWAAAGNINTSRERAASFGIEDAGVTVGGNVPPSHAHSSTVEHYDGSSWTNATAYPTAIKFASACGTQTDGLVFSGNTPPNSVTGLTFGYDGTSWSSRPSMGTARQAGAGAGTSTAALMMAGSNVGGTSLTTTEEFTGATETITSKTLTIS